MKLSFLTKIAKDVKVIGEKGKGLWNIIGYIRVSTKAQAEVQHGSPEQQRHSIIRWTHKLSEESGNQIRLFLIEEEVSGTEEAIGRRHGFNSIIQAIEAQLIDGVVAERIDRLGRSQNQVYELVQIAEKKGVVIYEVEGKVDLRDRSNRMGFKIKAMFAEEYSLDLKEKIPKKQREARVNNGKDIATVPCLGLDAHPTKSCMYIHNPVEQKQVLRMAEKCVELGGICNELLKFCEEHNIRTKVRWTKEKIDKDGNRIPSRQVGNNTFNFKRLHQLLTNPKLCGRGRFKDTWKQFPKLQDSEGYVNFNYAHEPVIPPELFEQVQFTISQRAHKMLKSGQSRIVYLLSGILTTNDGRRFQGASSNGGLNPYYQTSKKDIRIPKEKIERYVCNRVKQYIKESGVLEEVINTTLKHRLTGLPLIDTDIENAKSKLANLEKTKSGFSEALRIAVMKNSSNLIEITTALLEEKLRVEAELTDMEAKLTSLRETRAKVCERFQEKTLQDYLRLAMDKFDLQTDEAKKRIIQIVIPRLVYHPEEKQLDIHINTSPETGNRVTETRCHSGGNNLRVLDKWRGGRDSNSRPSA